MLVNMLVGKLVCVTVGIPKDVSRDASLGTVVNVEFILSRIPSMSELIVPGSVSGGVLAGV